MIKKLLPTQDMYNSTFTIGMEELSFFFIMNLNYLILKYWFCYNPFVHYVEARFVED